MKKPSVYLRLGRVSNLPTVWSDVLAGAVLGGGSPRPETVATTAFAMSSFYVGGMYLNDAFDRRVDARERPERPIPSGEIGAARVFAIGFGLLGIGAATVAAAGPASALAASGGLGAVIVLYDVWHKKNPLSPLLMGLCRVLVYVTAALATGGSLGAPAVAGCVALLGYLIGLTYLAKQETLAEPKNLWPLALLALPAAHAAWAVARTRTLGPLVAVGLAGLGAWLAYNVVLLRSDRSGKIPKAVAGLIAGIAIVDALHAAAYGAAAAAVAAACAFPLTLLLQRRVAGT